MTELSGSLETVPLGPLLGLLRQLRKNGRVHVSEGGWSGELYLQDGQVAAAVFGMARGLGGAPSGTLRGLAALEAVMLLLPRGAFFLTEGAPAAERTITVSDEELQAQLEALDEERRARGGAFPSLSAVPRRLDARDQPSADEQLLIERGQLNLLLAVDGHRTIVELVGDADLLKTFRDLRWLADQRLIVLPAAPGSAPGGASHATGDGLVEGGPSVVSVRAR